MKKYFFFVIFMFLFQFPVFSSNYDVGKKDPVKFNRRSIFRDDEIALFIGEPDSHKMYYYTLTPQNKDLTEWETEEMSYTFPPSHYSLIYSCLPPTDGDNGYGLYSSGSYYVVYGFLRPDEKTIQIERWSPHLGGYRVPEYKTLSGKHFSITASDLDQKVNEANEYTDEMIVARIVEENGKEILKITVLDRNMDIIAETNLNILIDSPFIIKVKVGDLNDDGIPEIVVVLHSGKENTQICICKFETSDNEYKITNCYNSKHSIYFRDMEVGDFNGDGKDDVAILSSRHLIIYQANETLGLTEVKKILMSSSTYSKMKKGLFHFDPEKGYGFGHSEIAIVKFNPGNAPYAASYLGFEIYRFNKNWEITDLKSHEEDVCEPGPYGTSGSGLYITTGNFKGHADENSVTDQIAVVFLEGSEYSAHPWLIVIDPTKDIFNSFVYEREIPLGDTPKNIILTSIDKDNDSYLLGVPVHIILKNHVTFDYIIQEPPKHVDYLPIDPDDPNSEWQIFNISGYRDFEVILEDDQQQTIESSSEQTASYSIGETESEDVSESVEAGFGDILKAEASIEDKETVENHFESEKSTLNSRFTSESIKYTTETNVDDSLHYKIKTTDIWRYPILNMTTENDKQGVYEIVIPRENPIDNQSNGKSYDDYQPLHENENILSYPHFVANENYTPPDLGSFTLPDGTVVENLMNKPITYEWSGNASSLIVSWSEEAGREESKSYTHSLSMSSEITAGISAEAEFFDAGIKESASVSFGLTEGTSLQTAFTEKVTNSKSRGLTINIPSQPNFVAGYAFQPCVYVDSSGIFKVTFATDPLGGENSDWWRKQYGKKPDPALNLPFRFVLRKEGDEEYWELQTDDSIRLQMRGFVVKKYEENPKTGKHDILGLAVKDGEKVLLCAKVYNFSLFQPTGQFKVSFYGVPIYHGEEVGEKFKIGETTVSLDPIVREEGNTYDYPENYEWCKEVSVVWDTTGYSHKEVTIMENGKSVKKYICTYRFYVILDEDNQVDEIHEWKDANGNKLLHGNNEGYWPWGKSFVVLAPGFQDTGENDIYLSDESLEIKTENGWQNGKGSTIEKVINVYTGNTYRLRVTIYSVNPHPFCQHVIFYDGDPENNGKIIGVRKIYGVNSGENYVWINWKPENEGIHKLWVKVTEDVHDINKDNATDFIIVNAISPLDSTSTACFIATATFGSPMAEEVKILRKFRDKYLMKTYTGKLFVKFYYKTSPPLARLIERHEFAKKTTKFFLKPIIWLCKEILQ